MADGEITLRLDSDTIRLLTKAADAEGVTLEDMLSRLAVEHAHDQIEWPPGTIDPDPEIDRRIARETRERGDGIPWEIFQERLRNFGRSKA